jgi:hypothetical protein
VFDHLQRGNERIRLGTEWPWSHVQVEFVERNLGTEPRWGAVDGLDGPPRARQALRERPSARTEINRARSRPRGGLEGGEDEPV